MNDATCQIEAHQAKRIISICFHTECKGKRICCQMCVNEQHKKHTDQLVNVDEVLHFIKTESKEPSVLSPQIDQRLSDLQNILKVIDEFSKLIKDEILTLSSMNAQQYFKKVGNQHNILQENVGSIGNQKWNQLIEDILPNIQINNLHYSIESIDHLSKSIACIHKKSIEIQQNLELIQKKIFFQNCSKPQVIEAHTNLVRGIDICNQKNLLVCGSDDKTVKLWNLQDNTLIRTFSHSGPVYGGNLIAFGGGGDYSIKLIDISDIKKEGIVSELRGHKSWINRLTFSNSSKFLISGSDDKTVTIWEVKTKKISFQLKTDSCVNGVAIKADDSLIASNQSNGIIKIWSVSDQKLMCSEQTQKEGTGIQFSNDQNYLVTSDTNGKIKLWTLKELNQNRLLFIRQFNISYKSIWSVIFSPCSRFIISICNQESEIKVIDSQTGEVVKLFKSKQKKDYNCVYVAISDDMNILVYGEDNNIVINRQK